MSQSYEMIRYIREGPDALRRTLEASEVPVLSLARRVRETGIQRMFLTGIGSSYTAAMMALPVFRYHCPLPTYVLSGPEMSCYASRLVDGQTLVIAVSRSGERGVVVSTLTEAVQRGALGVALTALPESLLAQKAQVCLVTAEGREITWPKTKSVVAATGLLMRLGLALAEPDDKEAADRLAVLRSVPQAMQDTLKATEAGVQDLVSETCKRQLVAVVGTGGNYGAAIEGAMKIMEASSVSTRFDSTDGLLSGPVGGTDWRWLVLPLVTAVDLQLARELLRVTRELGAHTLAISAPGLDLSGLAHHVLTLPVVPDPLLEALLYLPPLQLLAYYWTVARGMNPDAPASKKAILDALLPSGRQEPD
jgi:glucosamine--fructose-6-phosphate aminotransferase (isomerizing)